MDVCGKNWNVCVCVVGRGGRLSQRCQALPRDTRVLKVGHLAGEALQIAHSPSVSPDRTMLSMPCSATFLISFSVQQFWPELTHRMWATL